MKTSKFQIITLIIFIACIIAGVIAFATYRGTAKDKELPPITVWGTFPKAAFDQYVTEINYTLPVQMSVSYIQKAPASFSREFVAALARGTGPDAILIPADLLLASADKLTPIPYSVLPQRTFINTYIDQASVYLSQEGVLGIPFVTDPLVTYWNRDMFNEAGIVMCPDPSCKVYWDQFTGFNAKITQKQANGTITRSAIALGDFTNVTNAREIFGSLLLQLGNPVTVQGAGGSVSSAIKTNSSADTVPAVTFFTQFVNPTSENYSWNRSWPNSKTAFLAGNLATYFGLASELSDLRAKNPNLNFDIAPLPQVRTGGVKSGYSKLFGFSIVRASQNANTAYQIISSITAPQYLAKISASMYLPSVSRAVIAAGSSDPYMQIFNDQVLVAKTWLDADPAESGRIFGSMIQSVTSGQKSATQALNDADTQYNTVLRDVIGPSSSVQPSSMNAAAVGNAAAAIDGVPEVKLSKPTTNPNEPFGAFKLLICDGPAGANIDKDPDYRACDFKGLMQQVQYLINVMIILGLVGGMIGMAYAGYLYIQGTEKGISTAKGMLPKMFWGLIFMLTAWFIVSQILFWLTGTNSYLQN